jgi:hypothetical protein
MNDITQSRTANRVIARACRVALVGAFVQRAVTAPVELTPFHGHLIHKREGVRDANIKTTVAA